ncbi:Protein of unknown function [Pyronema omphalodes CBS 100304]|uniref:Uncharacterized protein n=1 Tax=Pyronema omphalodes (strain CBS 100304) TaxID=1076935 RepID=U4L0L9_PYROM|nr:Protein of unknown function [Pyronema omphalodes CBS 100304]
MQQSYSTNQSLPAVLLLLLLGLFTTSAAALDSISKVECDTLIAFGCIAFAVVVFAGGFHYFRRHRKQSAARCEEEERERERRAEEVAMMAKQMCSRCGKVLSGDWCIPRKKVAKLRTVIPKELGGQEYKESCAGPLTLDLGDLGLAKEGSPMMMNWSDIWKRGKADDQDMEKGLLVRGSGNE